MLHILKHAGAPPKALKLVPEIVDTCKICRMWKRPTPKAVTNTRLSTSFNDTVQWDILFYRKHMISHLLDEAVRWSAGSVLANKDAPALIKAITSDWFRIRSPMRVLIADGEKGLASEEVAQWLDRWKVELKAKAPGEHAQMVERHHELLRQLLHRVEAQLGDEGIAMPIEVIVGECLLAKNVMTTIAGHSPYRAVYGRGPPMLAESEPTSETQLDGASGGVPGYSRHTMRLREVAMQAMVQASAQQRIERALNSKTRLATEQLQLEQGDLVDFYRKPGTKDESGWRGPATVIKSEGSLTTVRWQSQNINVRTQDLRTTLVHLVTL